MPLTVIKGPPNSGRTDELERRFLDSIPRRPVLVVPGVDDVFDWERRLTRTTGAMVGGQIVHFRDLYVEILTAAGEPRLARATELQRLAYVREAIGAEHPELARVLPDQPGLAKAVLDLIDDFQTEMLDPNSVSSRASESGLRHLEPYSKVYRLYLSLLERDESTDAAGEAQLAIARINRSWPGRPVMFAGFDEMTGQQLETVRRLAFEVGADVTAAVSFEPENPAMNLTATLVSQLESLGPEDQVSRVETVRPDDLPHADNLLKLQRGFLDKESAESVDAREDWESFTVLRSAGKRNEAEAIAGEIARLVAGGGGMEPVPPGEIAIAVDQPAVNGRMIRDVLRDYSIPAALESETPAHATITGKAVLQYLAAIRPTGSARELIAYLRAPGGPPSGDVDTLELDCRIGDIKTAAGALNRLRGRRPEPLTDFEKRDPTELATEVARSVSRALLGSDDAAVPAESTVVEVRTAEAIAAACDEIREIEAEPERSPAITEAIQSGLVKTWVVPDQGTVRIASPYSLRAKRFEHLFFAGLQEAPVADTDRVGPFLSSDDLSSLAMSSRRDPEDQQRYLFYSCLTVPTRGLCLSCRVSDETGSPEHPSPLIEATESLFTREGDRAILRRGGRLGSDSVFDPADAPTYAELARSLRGVRIAETGVRGIAADQAAGIDLRQADAEAAAGRNRGLGDLSETVVARWAKDPVFSATELEAYSRCQYGWFIERQVGPQRFGPEPDHFAFGSLVHGVLEKLFAEDPRSMPGDGQIPPGWSEKIPGLVDEVSADRRIRLDTDSITHSAARRMAGLRVRLYLERQRDVRPFFEPALHELEFGTGKAALGAVRIGRDWLLKGKIDRVDLARPGDGESARAALVMDYKTGPVDAKFSVNSVEKERRFQIQLYMEALRVLGGESLDAGPLRPVAGMYVPIRLPREQSRGAAQSPEKKLSANPSEMARDLLSRGLADGDTVRSIETDFIEIGLGLANDAVEGIRAGTLDHDPASCPHHLDHPAVRNSALPEDDEGWRR